MAFITIAYMDSSKRSILIYPSKKAMADYTIAFGHE